VEGLGRLQVVQVEALHIQRVVVYMGLEADTVQQPEGGIVGEEVDNQDRRTVEGHLAEDTGCKEKLGILDDHIVRRVEHYIVVAEVDYKQFGVLKHRIADFADRPCIAEVGQVGADTLGQGARVWGIVGTPVLVVEETGYTC